MCLGELWYRTLRVRVVPSPNIRSEDFGMPCNNTTRLLVQQLPLKNSREYPSFPQGGCHPPPSSSMYNLRFRAVSPPTLGYDATGPGFGRGWLLARCPAQPWHLSHASSSMLRVFALQLKPKYSSPSHPQQQRLVVYSQSPNPTASSTRKLLTGERKKTRHTAGGAGTGGRQREENEQCTPSREAGPRRRRRPVRPPRTPP